MATNENERGQDSEIARIKSVAHGLGLKVGETWAHVFAENEKRAKKWTDEEISKFMKSEFTDRRPKNFDKPNRARRFYNRGGFTKGNVPTVLSKRWQCFYRARPA